jgi:hypothetical protein
MSAELPSYAPLRTHRQPAAAKTKRERKGAKNVPGESGKDFSGWSALQAASIRRSSWLLGWRESRSSKFDRDPVRGTNGGASRDAIAERRAHGRTSPCLFLCFLEVFLSADTKDLETTWIGDSHRNNQTNPTHLTSFVRRPSRGRHTVTPMSGRRHSPIRRGALDAEMCSTLTWHDVWSLTPAPHIHL